MSTHQNIRQNSQTRRERLSRELRVTNPSGLHLRAAAEIVKVALQFTSSITLARHGTIANARSILKVASLAASAGDTVTISAEGADAPQALEAMASLFNTGFYEETEDKSELNLRGGTGLMGLPPVPLQAVTMHPERG